MAGRPADAIGRAVTVLQREPSVGVLFTRLKLPGTFPLAEAGIDAPTAADIVVAARWSRPSPPGPHPQTMVINDGYTDYGPGGGMHATLSPLDLHNLAVASGPDFRRGVSDPLPSGDVDVAPTLLWLMGIRPPQRLDGRVLSEALAPAGPPPRGVRLGRRDARAELEGGTWEQYLTFTELNGVRYLEEGNGAWFPAARLGAGQASAR